MLRQCLDCDDPNTISAYIIDIDKFQARIKVFQTLLLKEKYSELIDMIGDRKKAILFMQELTLSRDLSLSTTADVNQFVSKVVVLWSVNGMTIPETLMLKCVQPLQVAWESCVGAMQNFFQESGIVDLEGLSAIFPAVTSDENDEKSIALNMECILSWPLEKLKSLAERAHAFRLCVGAPALFQKIANGTPYFPVAFLALAFLFPALIPLARLRQNASAWFHLPTLKEVMAHPSTGLVSIGNNLRSPCP